MNISICPVPETDLFIEWLPGNKKINYVKANHPYNG
jgi:hypothetical protein